MDPQSLDETVFYDLNLPKVASIFQVKFKSELVYVYVEYQQYSQPTFNDFIKSGKLKRSLNQIKRIFRDIRSDGGVVRVCRPFLCVRSNKEIFTKVKGQCQIEDNLDINIKDDKGCKIPDAITFAYFMQNVFRQQMIFEITISPRDNINESAAAVSLTPNLEVQYQPIYENPDKFFIHHLSKDLIHYFQNQTQIICSPTGAVLIQKYHVLKNSVLEIAHKKLIIQISANHLMLVKHNEPSVHDRTIWAKVICEIFGQLRDVNYDEYYFAVYNPNKGDGLLGNRVKLLLRTVKKAKENHSKIGEQNQLPTTVESMEHDLDDDLQIMVNFMKTAEASADVALIIEYHKKTFAVRQHYRRKRDIEKLISEFPRFFDVNGLIHNEFGRLYPSSGLATFTEDIQERILTIAQESSNYHKFPLTHKNLPQPLDALLHLIILLPPTSLGRGQNNRIKIELAFPRLVKIHENNQSLMDVTKDNPEKSPFILVSGSGDLDYYVVFHKKFIKCQTAFCAIDVFFKVHYIFNGKFDSSIRHVLGFIEYYFYNIKNLTPSSAMRLLNSRLSNK